MQEFLADYGDVAGKLVTLAVAVAACAIISRLVSRFMRRALDASSVPSASIFINIVRGVIWALGVLAVLKPVFGIEPTAFVTALGISSVVISFGLQDTVSNVFSGLGLMAGRVIQPGDYVAVGSFEGFVTDVNWRHTTVRDRAGDIEIIPNSVLNKTAFTRKGEAQRGSCAIEVSVAPDADLAQVSAEIVDAASKALGPLGDPARPPAVQFAGFDAYGTHGSVWIHAADDATFGAARDAVVRALQGRPWLASALEP